MLFCVHVTDHKNAPKVKDDLKAQGQRIEYTHPTLGYYFVRTVGSTSWADLRNTVGTTGVVARVENGAI